MNTDWKALCAELLEALENAIRVIYHEDGTKHISTADAVIAKADTALAQPEPATATETAVALAAHTVGGGNDTLPRCTVGAERGAPRLRHCIKAVVPDPVRLSTGQARCHRQTVERYPQLPERAAL